MQNQLIHNNFQNGTALIRNNLNFVGPTNKKMKEDADQFRRRLSMSYSYSNLKPNSNHLRSSQASGLVQNNQNWTNSQQTTKNNVSFTKATQGQPRVVVTSAESSADIVSRLSVELSEAKKEIDNLKRIIAKNEEQAQAYLVNYQAVLNKLQIENKQLHIELQYNLTALQQSKKNSQPAECSRCPDLQNIIRNLELQLRNAKSALGEKTDIGLKFEQENKLLKLNISKWQQQYKSIQQEHNLLAYQFSKKIEEFEYTQVVLRQKDQLIAQIQQRFSQNQEELARIQTTSAQRDERFRLNKHQLDEQQTQMAHINNEKRQLLTRNQQLAYSLTVLNTQNQKLDYSIAVITRQKQDLIAKISLSDQAVTALSQTLAVKENQIEDIGKYVEQLNKQIYQANQKARKAEAISAYLAQAQKQLSKKSSTTLPSSQQILKNLNLLTQNNTLKQLNEYLIKKVEKIEQDLSYLEQYNNRLQYQLTEKNTLIQDLIAHPILPKQQQQYIHSILKQNQDKLLYISEITQQLVQCQQKIAAHSKEKEQLYNGIRQLQINHKNAMEETLFYKNKLQEAEDNITEGNRYRSGLIIRIQQLQVVLIQQKQAYKIKLQEAEDYIAEVNRQKNKLISLIQQLQAYIQKKQANKIRQEAQISSQNAQLRQDIQALLQEIQHLKEENNIANFRSRDTQTLIKILQSQLSALQIKSKEDSQKIQFLNRQQYNHDQNAKKDHMLLQQLQSQIQRLNQKLAQTQKFNNTDPLSDQSLRSLKQKVAQLQIVITQLTNEANFFKNQLIHVQKFIYRLLRQSGDNQKIRESIRLLGQEMQINLEGQTRNDSIADQIQDSDTKEAESKRKETERSLQEIQASLNEFKNKARAAEEQIAKLQYQKAFAVTKTQEASQQLNQIVQQTQFLRQRLTQAEGYIKYMQSLQWKQAHTQSSDQLVQLQRLRGELRVLQQENRQLILEKIKADENLENNLVLVKNLQQSLVVQRNRLREAQGHIAQLQAQKQQAANQLVELRVLLEQANLQAAFFRDKLQQAQDHINSINPNQSNFSDQERNQLLLQLTALQQQKQLLEQLRHTSTLQSKNRQDLLKSLQRSVSELNSRVLEADARVNKFNQQQQISEQRARNAIPLENKLNQALILIEELKNQIQHLKNQLNTYKDQQISFPSEQIQLQNKAELQYFKNKLGEAENYITLNENQNVHLHQTVSNLEYQILVLERERKKLQSKILPENKLEELKAESDFFKMKLLLAEQYITQLQKRTNTGQESLIVSVVQGRNQNDQRNSIQFVNKILAQLKETKKQLQIQQVNAHVRQQHYKQTVEQLQSKLSANIIGNAQEYNNVQAKDVKNNYQSQEIQPLKQRILQAESYIAEIQKELLSVNDRVKKLQAQVAELQQDKKEINQQVKRLQDSIGQCQQQNIHINLKAQKLEGYIIGLQQQNNSLINTTQKLQQEVEILTNNLATIKDQLINQSNQKYIIQSINRQLTNQNQKIKAQVQTQNIAPIQIAKKDQLNLQQIQPEGQRSIFEREVTRQIQNQTSALQKIDEAAAQFFKGKLKEAEVYITQLQEENQNYGNAISLLNQQIQQLKTDLSAAHSSLSKSNQERQFLIIQLQGLSHQHQHVKQTHSAETLSYLKTISILEKRLQSEKKLTALSASQAVSKAELLKQNKQRQDQVKQETKRLQRLVQRLQDQNYKLKEELGQLYEKTQNLREALLRLQCSQANQNEQVLKDNQILRETISQHQSKLQEAQIQNKKITRQLQACQKQIAELKDLLRLKDNYIWNLQERNNQATNDQQPTRRPQAVIQYQQQTIQNIYQEMPIASKIKPANQQDSQVQHKLRSPIQDAPTDQQIQFFKDKLHEAEVHISELQDQNESINKAIEALEDQVKVLKAEVNNLNQKLLTSDSQKGVYQQKSYKLSESLTFQIARISYLQQRINELQQELQYRNNKNQQQLITVHQKQLLSNQNQQKNQDQIQILRNQNDGLKRQLQIYHIEQNQSREQLAALHQLLQAKQKEIIQFKQLTEANQYLPSNISLKSLDKLNINTEESQPTTTREEQLGQTVLKIIEMTKSYSQDTQPQQNFGQLDSFPYLNELIQSILYRLKLSSAIDIQKSLKINKLTKELEIANNKNKQGNILNLKIDELQRQIDQLQINNQQITGQLSMYQEINHELSNQLSYITQEVDLYKQKIDYYQTKSAQIPDQENNPGRNSQQAYRQFLNTCLPIITAVQEQVYKIETQISNISLAKNNNKQAQSGVEESLSVSSRDGLLREINSLNNAVEIYHQESTRRQKQYKLSIENLLQDLCALKYLYDQLNQQKDNDQITEGISQLGLKMKAILDNDQNQITQQTRNNQQPSLYPPHYRQIIKTDNQKIQSLNRQQVPVEPLSFSEASIQTDEDAKPFLNYVLNVRDLDKEDILLLKKKISSMRSKQIQDNMQLLQEQQNKLQQILLQNNIENTPKQIDNIILTLAHNLSNDQIRQIFASQDSDQILKKINQALDIQNSYLRGLNPTIIIRQIQQRMMLYYEKPTKLSEVMHNYLINLLLAKTEQDLYNIIQGFFRELSQIENQFEAALNKKDQVYRVHNQKMNKIFTRSMSDLSEDQIRAFEAHAQEIDPAAIQQNDPESSSFTVREREQL